MVCLSFPIWKEVVLHAMCEKLGRPWRGLRQEAGCVAMDQEAVARLPKGVITVRVI